MTTEIIICVLFVGAFALAMLGLWLIQRSDTTAGRALRAWNEKSGKAHRRKLSGYR